MCRLCSVAEDTVPTDDFCSRRCSSASLCAPRRTREPMPFPQTIQDNDVRKDLRNLSLFVFHNSDNLLSKLLINNLLSVS